MKLNELKKYRSYCSELNEVKGKLNSSKSMDSSVWLLYRKKQLEDQIIAMERFVDSISEYKVWRALTIYCLEPIGENDKTPDWEDVACKIGNGCTESSIKKTVSRFFKKF